MRHLLMDPAFPDIVETWAASRPADAQPVRGDCANDNRDEAADDLADPLLTMLAKLEIAATRLW